MTGPPDKDVVSLAISNAHAPCHCPVMKVTHCWTWNCFRRQSNHATNDKAALRRPVIECFCQKLKLPRISGAGEGIRTLDPDLGKVVLYH
jgi:hypothetical protein